jgi:hypothetical protein
MMFDMEDIIFIATTDLLKTKDGFIKPELYAIDFKWGKTKFYHENWLLSLIFDDWIKFILVII